MKVLGFSHLTFCLSEDLKYYGTTFFGQSFQSEIANSPEKFPLMFGKDPFHYLYWNRLGIEITSYQNTLRADWDDRHRTLAFLENFKSQSSPVRMCLPKGSFDFLSLYGSLKEVAANTFKLRGIGLLPSITIVRECSPNALHFSPYLDKEGLVSMALYVDELTHSTKDFSLSTNDYSSQIFTIELGTTQLNIKLEKVEGVVFELISRS